MIHERMGRRGFLGLLASAAATAMPLHGAASPATMPGGTSFPRAINLLPETAWGERVALFGMDHVSARVITTVAASPRVVSYEEWLSTVEQPDIQQVSDGVAALDGSSGGIRLDMQDTHRPTPGWCSTTDMGAALATFGLASPSLSLFAVSGGDARDIEAALGAASVVAKDGGYAAVFTLADRADLGWPSCHDKGVNLGVAISSRIARIKVLADGEDTDASLTAAMLAVLGPSRGFGVIGVDMSDVTSAVFQGGYGYALTMSARPEEAPSIRTILEAKAEDFGIDLHAVRRALVTVAMPLGLSLSELDQVVAGIRSCLRDSFDRNGPGMVMAAQYDDQEPLIRATLIAFQDEVFPTA
jgi:hypothetical protein